MNKFLFVSSSYSTDERDQRIRISKIGFLGRLAIIFRVNKILIYDDRDPKLDGAKEGNFLKSVLEYLECPQYLRKFFFPLRREFRYLGALPPLRSAGHPKITEEQDIREGVVLRTGRRRSFIYVGLENEISIKEKLPINQRVLVNIPKKRLIDKSDLDYWSYDVFFYKSLGEAISKNKVDLLIGTSRKGNDIRFAKKLFRDLKKSNSVGIAFGSPFYRGLEEILAGEGLGIDIFDYYLNMIPNQGSRVVRSEEAIAATLACLNLLI